MNWWIGITLWAVLAGVCLLFVRAAHVDDPFSIDEPFGDV